MERLKINKILLVLDNDQSALEVAENGLSFARKLDAKIILLNVVLSSAYYNPPKKSSLVGFSGLAPWKLLEDEDKAEHLGLEFLKEIKRQLGDENIQTLVRQGHLEKTVSKIVEELNIDIVVMAVHEHKWLDRIAGNPANNVLKNSKVPVMLLPGFPNSA